MHTTSSSAWQERTGVLLGQDRLNQLQRKHVLIVGVGGVGGTAAEMLVRAGIGRITLLDADVVAPSNINRQLVALHSTISQPKVSVLGQRLKDINPVLQLTTSPTFLTAEEVPALLEGLAPDYIIDAIDTIQPKCALIATALRQKIRIISSMGAGAKTDITQIRYADISETYHCGLSKAVRHGLKAAGLRGKRLPVVFCTQQADPAALIHVVGERNKKTSAGTISYMPATFGAYLAAYVLRHI